MTASDITVASVYATDRIYDEAGNWIRNQEGGPCLFIVEALKQQKISHNVLSPEQKALVDIKIDKNGEVGTIKFTPVSEIDWSSINSLYLLISTLLDEFPLDKIDTYNGNVCLDVQGFTRKAKTESKTIWTVPEALYKNCFCLKATEEELKYLPQQFVDQQKQKILLITKGSRGVAYWEKGKHKEAFPKEIIACSNAIGAGDTFFANVIAGLSRNESVDTAIEKSLSMTSAFLKRNLSPFK